MNTPNHPIGDQVIKENRPSEPAATQPAVKKLFVEPTVSAPADVLEATTFFQTPTIESSSV